MKLAQYKFSNKEQLKKYLEKIAIDGLRYCAGRAEIMLKRLLKKRLYDAYDQSMYDRTYELLNSISHSEVIKENNNSYYVEIYYDTDEIRSYPRKEDGLFSYKWGQHTSFDGEDTSEWIPLWIEEGTDNQYYSHKGTHSIEDTKEWLSKEYNRLFRIALKQKYGNNIQ